MSEKIKFHNDFVAGWSFAVHRAFQAALDLKPIKKEEDVWKLGSLFSFKEGDVLWDTPLATRLATWGEALPYIRIGLQVDIATPAQWKKGADEKVLPGRVIATIYRLTGDSVEVKADGTIRCAQLEFVEMLRNGINQKFVT